MSTLMSNVAEPMKVEREDLNPATVKLTVTCTPEQVTSGFSRAVKALGKKIRVPGFRPGAAPAKMVEGLINPEDLYRTAAEETVKIAYNGLLKSQSLEPVAQPSVEISKFEREPAECIFFVTVPLPAVVELVEYKGLSIHRPAIEVTDEEIETQIEDMRRRGGKRQEIKDRGIEPGDVAVVNLRPEGDQADGRNFMVIAGQTFGQLDEAIAGMGSEAIKSVELTFPDNFQDKDWANTTKSCTVTVRSVNNVILPDEDEFAQSLSLENKEQLREAIKTAITRAKENMGQEMVNEQLLDILRTQSTVHVSDTTWTSVADRRLSELAQELAQKGQSLDDLAKKNNMTLEEFVTAQRKEAKLHVERAVIIEKIFKTEGMKISEADVNRHALQIAEENHFTL
ncbi:MAG: trigger factor [Fimbriimonadaceae bacterium]|nr:trigger factor [Fimbriimonadaceae bacterium]